MRRIAFNALSLSIAAVLCAADAPMPATATITLKERHGHATPTRRGFQHTGGGNIDVAQPTPDALVITMTGVAVAGPHPTKTSEASFEFDLSQCMEIAFSKPEVKKGKLTMEARVIGLLRSQRKGGGSAQEGPGQATLSAGEAVLATVSAPAHVVSCGDNLSLNDHDGPVAIAVGPGTYTLHQTFAVRVLNPRCALPCKAASAEFAPDPALDPLWISYFEPFHGAAKKDFGFQVTVKVAPE